MLRQKHEISKTNKIFFIYLSRVKPYSSSQVSVCSLLFNSIDPLTNYFSVFVLPGEVPGCIPSKISYPFFSIRKSEDSLFFCCRILNFLPIFLIFCCILELGQFFNCFTCKQNYPPVFSQDSTLHCQNYSILFRKNLSKDTDTRIPPWADREKVKRRGGELRWWRNWRWCWCWRYFLFVSQVSF